MYVALIVVVHNNYQLSRYRHHSQLSLLTRCDEVTTSECLIATVTIMYKCLSVELNVSIAMFAIWPAWLLLCCSFPAFSVAC